ncbi:hypothetical protein [Pseudobdellovibrio exovorus]|uniref:Lipoprotein n=1 Tax=Pseudobdellovibrio exovorus JSS TaxID=1184267 RepID=M4V5G2_9BACT|nr:hypothetical protein [Pseudobdellovibrio exovorus]AGH94423.1 hypothetical protein A11Q_203 [Pseudobdellovibrio exovorus JSS]
MKNPLSKALLCGVLASTFVLLNCQKPPDRGVKAEITPNAKTSGGPAAVVADCSQEALTAISSRGEILTQINVLVEDSKKEGGLDQAQKQQLQNLVTELNTATEAARAAIQTLKVGNESANACSEKDAADPTKEKAKHVIVSMLEQNRRVASVVQGITGQSNVILDAGSTEGGAPQLEMIQNDTALRTNAVVLADGAEMTIAKEDLATVLKDSASKDGESFIVNAALQRTAAQYQAAVADKNITACKATVAAANAAVDTTLKVMNIEDLKQEGERSVLNVNLQVGEEGLATLSCVIADAAKANAAQEVVRTLGDLVEKKEAAATSPEADEAANNTAGGNADAGSAGAGSGEQQGS